MSVDPRQQRIRVAMKALEWAGVGFVSIAPSAVVVLAGQDEARFALQTRDRIGKLVISAHVREIARPKKVSGVGEMHVAVGKRRHDRCAVEIHAFDADAGWLFIQRHDDRVVHEQRVVTTQTLAGRVERVDASVMEQPHAVMIR